MKLVPADAERDKVGQGWVTAKYCRHEMRLIRVGEDMHVLSGVPLVRALVPVPLPSVRMEENIEGHHEGGQAHEGHNEARRPMFDIPAKGEDMSDCGDATMVDCGELGYVSNPKEGVVYRFPKSNKNSDYVAFVRGKAHSHSPNSTTGKCQGCLQCQYCRYKHKPATTKEGIDKQIKNTHCFNCKTKTLKHIPCSYNSIRTKLTDGTHTLQGEGEHSDHPTPPNIRPPPLS